MWVLGIRRQVHMLLLQVLHLLNVNLTSQFFFGLSWCQGRIMNLYLVFISVLKSFFWYYFASRFFFLKNNFSVQSMWVVSMHMCVLRVHLVSSVILTHSFEAKSLRQRGARLPVNKPQWLCPYNSAGVADVCSHVQHSSPQILKIIWDCLFWLPPAPISFPPSFLFIFLIYSRVFIALIILELVMWNRLASDSEICLCLPCEYWD